MNRRIWIILGLFNLILIRQGSVQASNYVIDLTEGSKFQVIVSDIHCVTDALKFTFNTSAVHGDVRIVNYADMVSSFKAFDADGNLLPTRRDKSGSTFIILKAREINKITYQFESSWQTRKWKQLFPPSGTCFLADEYYYFTTLTLLGYIDNEQDNLIDLSIIKPAGLKSLLGIDYSENANNTLSVKDVTLKQLGESPVVFTSHDTANLQVKGTTFMLSTFSEDGTSHVDLMRKELKAYVQAIANFFPIMPVKKYNIAVYVKDVKRWGEKYRAGNLGMFSFFRMMMQMDKPGFGANGYGKGTAYCVADLGNDYYLTEGINSTLIHEFIHIVIPYQFFQDGAFDESGSKNNWLWEGATTYFELLAQLQSGLLSQHEFLNIMRVNIVDSYSLPRTYSFTELCANINEKPYNNHRMQVYWTGSVVAMLLDFEIMKLTKGDKTLKSVLFKIADKYSSSKKSISEDEVIPEIVASVTPGLQDFFDRFINGKDSLDIAGGLDAAGFEYHRKIQRLNPADPIWNNDVVTGKFILPPDSKNPEYVITKVGESDFVGFKKGDRVKRYDIIKSLTGVNGKNLLEGEETRLRITRDNKPFILTYTIKYRDGNYQYHISENLQKTPLQEKLLKTWLTGQSLTK